MRPRKVTGLLSIVLLSAFMLSSCGSLVGVALPFQPPLPSLPTPSGTDAAPEYCSPLPDAQYVSKGATIAVRYGPVLTPQVVHGLKFNIQGAKSGLHAGQVILAADDRTVVFKPDELFTPGEKVTVHVSRLDLSGEDGYPALSYSFTVATNQQVGTPGSTQLDRPPIPGKPPRSAFPNFLTVPQDIPHFTISQGGVANNEGDIFVAPFYWTESTVGSYLLILNQKGQLVYWQSAAPALDAWDFKAQPNGLLSYYDQKHAIVYVMNSHYETVDVYRAGNGYTADLHEFQMLPNGNALLLVYDAETVDMSRVVLGGNPAATVTGLIIQELDPKHNVIFEWRSWDHFSYLDSEFSLMTQKIDLVHGNAVALSQDGNLLLSSRNLSEITKIDFKTGRILWRLGGKNNMFQFINGEPFAYQHDVRELPDGNITVFDNHGLPESPAPSRAVEYKLDETARTATQVWEYTLPTPVFGTYMGSAQRLSNGNTFISWGAPYTKQGYQYASLTEVTPDNITVFDLLFDQPYVSYRAFVMPWQGIPHTKPTLVFKAEGDGIKLAYSWNGATNVASYRLYGGGTPQTLKPLEDRTRTDFEMQSHVSGPPAGECYFQVAALDRAGQELARSSILSTDGWHCPVIP